MNTFIRQCTSTYRFCLQRQQFFHFTYTGRSHCTSEEFISPHPSNKTPPSRRAFIGLRDEPFSAHFLKLSVLDLRIYVSVKMNTSILCDGSAVYPSGAHTDTNCLGSLDLAQRFFMFHVTCKDCILSKCQMNLIVEVALDSCFLTPVEKAVYVTRTASHWPSLKL